MPQHPQIIVHTFDLIRLNRVTEIGLSVNTVKKYAAAGLNLYQRKGDRATFVSKAELEAFIKGNPVKL